MWQSAITPSDRKSIAGGICCLAILIAMHLGLIAALELPRIEPPSGAEATLLFFEFPPEVEPEETLLDAAALEAPTALQAQAALESPAALQIPAVLETPAVPEPEPPALLQTEPAAAPRTAALPVSAPEEAPSPQSGFGEAVGVEGYDAAPAGEAGSPGAFGGTAGTVPGFSRGRTGPMAEADYIALLLRRLEEKKVYPLAMRKRGIAGDVALFLTIRPDGSLGDLRAGENPHPFLAEAALQTARSAAPFPVWERHRGEYSLRVTMRFQLE